MQRRPGQPRRAAQRSAPASRFAADTAGRGPARLEISQTTDEGYWLRRESDRSVLPSPFVADDVRQRS